MSYRDIATIVSRQARIAAALMAMFPVSFAACADDAAARYPNRPIKIIACVPPGGGVDTVTRIVAEALQRQFGQPVVVENRGGGGGNIGTDAVYHSEPDGYTLLAAQPPPLTINAHLYRKLNFDPAKLEPIAVMTTIANVLLMRPDFPAKTAADFLAYIKANPGRINYASQGVGTTAHLTAELFAQRAGLALTHVPYRGTGPALNDLIASHVDMMFVELASSLPLHRSGRARIVAVAVDRRLPELPDVPTLGELGLVDFRSILERACRPAGNAARDRREAQCGGE